MIESVALLIIGIIIGLLITFLVEYLRHHWKMSERYQELLAERRLSACDELRGRLVKLYEEDFSPLEKGVNALKDSVVAGRIDKLAYFVAMNEMALGIKVARIWYNYYKVLLYIRNEVQNSSGGIGYLSSALKKLMSDWIDKTGQAIKEQLQGANVEFIPSSELTSLAKESQTIGKTLIAQAEKKKAK